jgi:SAM-dependent methyltransferase
VTGSLTGSGPVAEDRFDLGLSGLAHRLDRSGARPVRVATRRWRAEACRSDRWLLDRCAGPTIDLGCGPGRLVVALGRRGVPALGVDSSRLAERLCDGRDAPVLRRDLFGPLPGEGRWRHALLADGNLGIGGDPVALLRRTRLLLAPGGTVLVELAGDGGLWRGPARLVGPDGAGTGWFPWAQVGVDAIGAVAGAAGLRVAAVRRGRRRFAELAGTAG